jgi:NhaA family Na+:H+ antiporter
MIGGIGCTMWLFIGMMAFSDATHASPLRLGVLFGSLLSAMAGYAVLRLSAPAPHGSPE